MNVDDQKKWMICATVSSLFMFVFMSIHLETPPHVQMGRTFQRFMELYGNSLTSLQQNVTLYQNLKRDNFPQVDCSSSFHGGAKKIILPEEANKDSYIIYTCSDICGGIGDRQRGIVSVYVLSQMLRRKFGLIMRKGCNFATYVIPNLVNWTVDPALLTGRSSDYKNSLDQMEFGYTMRDGDLEKIFDKNVTFLKTNMDFVPFFMNKTSYLSLAWTKQQSICDVYRIAFSHLFKLAPNTQRKYEEFHKKVNNSILLCAHLRMGYSKTLPKDLDFGQRKPNPQMVIQFLRERINHFSKLFIATDSNVVRRLFFDAYPDKFIEIGGSIVHIDQFVGRLDCSGMEKVILDQFILSTCDTLVISYSGFSVNAAIMRGSDDELYAASFKNITKVKRLIPNWNTSPQYLNTLH